MKRSKSGLKLSAGDLEISLKEFRDKYLKPLAKSMAKELKDEGVFSRSKSGELSLVKRLRADFDLAIEERNLAIRDEHAVMETNASQLVIIGDYEKENKRLCSEVQRLSQENGSLSKRLKKALKKLKRFM